MKEKQVCHSYTTLSSLSFKSVFLTQAAVGKDLQMKTSVWTELHWTCSRLAVPCMVPCHQFQSTGNAHAGMQLFISLLLFCLQVAKNSWVSIIFFPWSDVASLCLNIMMLLCFLLSDEINPDIIHHYSNKTRGRTQVLVC